jgi:DNA-binding transcriptional LysR family regulator
VKKFMIRYPNVNMHIEYFSADKVYEMVLSGEFDIGLVAVRNGITFGRSIPACR